MAYNDLFMRAARLEPTERTPVWMMRQAGRYMEEYRAIRAKHGFLELCRTPITLASYAIEGQGTRDYEHCKSLMWGDPVAWDMLMTKFTDTVIAYLCAQIDAGAQVVQVFDSWVGYVAPRDYEKSILPYTKRVLAEIKAHGDKVVPGGVPVIHFANGAASMLDLVQQAGGDIVGVDWRLDMKKVVEQVDPNFGIQCNIDPVALFAPEAELEAMVVGILEAVGTRPGHIFNLGHGIHKTSDPEKARAMIRFVHEHSDRIRAGA
jgi:uroporphyrinogen decarboxylase